MLIMNLFKNYSFVLIFMLNFLMSFGQSLTVPDLRKSFNYTKSSEHKYLSSKGFVLLKDYISIKIKKFNYQQPNTNEIVNIMFIEDGEGGQYLKIKYLVPSEILYKKFISKLPAFKFKYSKRNSRFQLPTSSYSGENITANGIKKIGTILYFELLYENYVGKALGLRPVTNNNNYFPPEIDTTNR